METSNVSIKKAHRVGENSNKSNKKRAIVDQFSFYKDKANIVKNCKEA